MLDPNKIKATAARLNRRVDQAIAKRRITAHMLPSEVKSLANILDEVAAHITASTYLAECCKCGSAVSMTVTDKAPEVVVCGCGYSMRLRRVED
jgi:hypothetical protein